MCNTSFQGNLTGKSIYSIIWSLRVIFKVIFKVKTPPHWLWMIFWSLLWPLIRHLTASHHHLMPLCHPSMPPDRLLTPYGRHLMPPHRHLICNCHLLMHLSHFHVFSWPFTCMRLHGALGFFCCASRPFRCHLLHLRSSLRRLCRPLKPILPSWRLSHHALAPLLHPLNSKVK